MMNCSPLFLLSTVFIRNTFFCSYSAIQRNGNPIQINGNFSKETGTMQRNRKPKNATTLKKCNHPPKNATTHLKMQPLRLRVSLHYSVSYIFRLFGSKETGGFSAVSLYAVFPCFTYFCKIKNATILYQSLRLDVANHSTNDTMQPFRFSVSLQDCRFVP